jgi:hypothetical protein
MTIDKKVTTFVTREVTRRSFFRRMAGWGVVAGFGLSGVSSLTTRRPAWAITCSQADQSNSGLCNCNPGCQNPVEKYCPGCNGSEYSDGCPPSYNPNYGCAYGQTGCWCTKNCCVKRGDSFQRRRRMCCDCQHATDDMDLCLCAGPKQWGSSCTEQQWILDGRVTDGDVLDNIFAP